MFECEKCKAQTSHVVYRDAVRMCGRCYNELVGVANPATFVHGDETDVWIQHGICNDDGTPKRYRSKREIKEAAFAKGLFQGYDTPKVNQRLEERRAREAESKRDEG